jgi:hypothetical protein
MKREWKKREPSLEINKGVKESKVIPELEKDWKEMEAIPEVDKGVEGVT